MLSSPRDLGRISNAERDMQDHIQQHLIGELAPGHVVALETALREDPRLAALGRAGPGAAAAERAAARTLLRHPGRACA